MTEDHTDRFDRAADLARDILPAIDAEIVAALVGRTGIVEADVRYWIGEYMKA